MPALKDSILMFVSSISMFIAEWGKSLSVRLGRLRSGPGGYFALAPPPGQQQPPVGNVFICRGIDISVLGLLMDLFRLFSGYQFGFHFQRCLRFGIRSVNAAGLKRASVMH